MKDLGERVASLEVEVKSMKESVERFRNHISDLLDFQGQVKGGLLTVKILMGIIGLQGAATLVTLWMK